VPLVVFGIQFAPLNILLSVENIPGLVRSYPPFVFLYQFFFAQVIITFSIATFFRVLCLRFLRAVLIDLTSLDLIGNRLQFEDSCICESVMLHFAAMDAPALPVHDSFIMHHRYGGELEESMRRSFHERFGSDIPRKKEIIDFETSDDRPPRTLDIDEVMNADSEYSQWLSRNDAWVLQKI